MSKFKCIECGATVSTLYKQFSSEIIKITRCDLCGSVADMYIECDLVLILINTILHKRSAYRHLLFNANPPSIWKLIIVYILCSTYTSWVSFLRPIFGHMPTEIIFTNVCVLFFIEAAGWLWLLISVNILLKLVGLNDSLNDSSNMLYVTKAVIISSYGTLFSAMAIIWANDDFKYFLYLSQFFVLTSNITAIRVIGNLHLLKVIIVLSFSTIQKMLLVQYLINFFLFENKSSSYFLI